MLTRSGLDRSFWYDAYRVAQYMCNRLPTKTTKGFMTPYEFIHDKAPNMEYIRIWGCKCYVREARSNIKSDWSDRSKVGYLVGYSETPIGWVVYIPSVGSCVTSVHVIFNEEIPKYDIEYFQELRNELVLEEEKERTPEDFLYLVGTRHFDEEEFETYEVNRIAITNDANRHIIAYRSPIVLGVNRISKEEAIYVRDVEKMYAATLGTGADKLRPGGILGDGPDSEESETDSGRVVSTSMTHQGSECSDERGMNRVVKKAKRRRRKADIPVVTTSSSSQVVSMESDVETGKYRRVSNRKRTPNNVTNVSSLGDIGSSRDIYKDVCNMFSESGGDAEDEKDPASTKEALNGARSKEWQESIDAENRALYDREVFDVIERPEELGLLNTFLYICTSGGEDLHETTSR